MHLLKEENKNIKLTKQQIKLQLKSQCKLQENNCNKIKIGFKHYLKIE